MQLAANRHSSVLQVPPVIRWLLLSQGTGSVDAVVAFNGLASAGTKTQQYFAEVARVLKPGAPFVFIDRGARLRNVAVITHAGIRCGRLTLACS